MNAEGPRPGRQRDAPRASLGCLLHRQEVRRRCCFGAAAAAAEPPWALKRPATTVPLACRVHVCVRRSVVCNTGWPAGLRQTSLSGCAPRASSGRPMLWEGDSCSSGQPLLGSSGLAHWIGGTATTPFVRWCHQCHRGSATGAVPPGRCCVRRGKFEKEFGRHVHASSWLRLR